MNDSQREAIATADAHTTNVALPSYSEVCRALAYLSQQAARSDLPASNAARRLAEKVLHGIRA